MPQGARIIHDQARSVAMGRSNVTLISLRSGLTSTAFAFGSTATTRGGVSPGSALAAGRGRSGSSRRSRQMYQLG